MTDPTSTDREAWNSRAKSYDTEPYMRKINTQIIEALTSRLEWIGGGLNGGGGHDGGEKDGCRLLDYACGTGKITMALRPYLTSAKGLDISTSMIDVYNQNMDALRSSPSSSFPDGDDKIDNNNDTRTATTNTTFHASATLGDFVAEVASGPSESDPEWTDFDVAAIGLGFHHFENPELCLTRLAQRVKKATGVVLIIDWLPHAPHDDHNHDHGHSHDHGHKKKDEWEAMQKTIKHHGFDRQTMQRMFEDAGLVDFDFVVLGEPFVLLPQ
ncbi:hypothetical protein AAFC00_001520 [Neodothiora populina]